MKSGYNLKNGDWVRCICNTFKTAAGDEGCIVDVDLPCYLVQWYKGRAATDGDWLWWISKYHVVRIEPDNLAYPGEVWRHVATSQSAEQAKQETNARRLLRMLHQWACFDGRYKGGNLWKEVEKELQ